MPVRIQRKRTKGFRLPTGCIYVGRPSKWGNPYAMGGVTLAGITAGPQTRSDVVEMFRANFVNEGLDATELRGKDLACWCPLEDGEENRVPCHADVLLELANREGDA